MARTKDTGQPPVKTKQIQQQYERSLRGVARQVGRIINGFPPLEASALAQLTDALRRYAEIITPWAEVTGMRMVQQVEQQDRRAWRTATEEMGRGMRQELMAAPIGDTVRERLAAQVHLIKSLPIEAAQRVHQLTLEAAINSTRTSEIAKEIARSGEVTSSRATLIARTEVGRTATELTRARSKSVGSEGYIWRTAEDSDVRESHRKMEGRFVKWSKPPTLDNLTGHAGTLPNCRCWPEVVIPKRIT